MIVGTAAVAQGPGADLLPTDDERDLDLGAQHGIQLGPQRHHLRAPGGVVLDRFVVGIGHDAGHDSYLQIGCSAAVGA